MTAKSPFPGMDPYLEAHWRDVHASMVLYIRNRLQRALPGELRARVEERVYVESDPGARRKVYPDVRVIERPRGVGTAASSTPVGSAATVADPLIVHLPSEPVTETFIEILDTRAGYRVVTVIEVLSPANKTPGDGQDLYLKKQREVLKAGVSLVEIDLVRAGRRILSVPEGAIPATHRTLYRVVVRRGYRLDRGEVYGVTLRDRLPPIKVPLREKDSDATIDLQSILEDCYADARYDDIDYRESLDPPLAPEDEAWVDQLLRAAGAR